MDHYLISYNATFNDEGPQQPSDLSALPSVPTMHPISEPGGSHSRAAASVTNDAGTRYPCPVCTKYDGEKAFPRRDHLLQHLKGRHNFDKKGIAFIDATIGRKAPARAMGNNAGAVAQNEGEKEEKKEGETTPSDSTKTSVMSSSLEITSTTDLPTGDPVPSSVAPTPAPKPAPFPLRSLLAATPSNVDAFLAHLQRCLSTPSGIDTVLQIVCYSSRLTAAVLTTLVQPALQRSATRLIALAAALPPSTTLIFDAKALPSSSVAFVLNLAKRLKALSGLTSEARTILRLWGLLSMYFWGRRLVLNWRQQKKQGEDGTNTKSSATTFETSIAWSQLAACVAFQALENGVYLSSKGVLEWAPATQGKMARWSARFWGSFVGLELIRLFYESSRRARRTRAEKFAGGKTVAVVEREEREWAETWRKTVVRNLAWAPLTVHWSLEQGLVSELAVGALASIPSIIQIRDLWRRTAE
ncbi:hypothetical protein F5Y01DRAFT_311794 [Xylaria sp. FL0043]|nr:hypothetical protein F5Y01DRAFT_311794 [Xylaria sp. FL0043]